MAAGDKIPDTFTLDRGLLAKDCSVLAREVRDGRRVVVVLVEPRSGMAGRRRVRVYQEQVLRDELESDRAAHGRGKR